MAPTIGKLTDDLNLREYWKFTAGASPALPYRNDFLDHRRIVMGHGRVIQDWTKFSGREELKDGVVYSLPSSP